MPTDIEIAQNAPLHPITEIAENLGIPPDDLDLYGKYKAKLTAGFIARLQEKKERGKLVLVTAISPTPAGEGKTTVTVGLGQALCRMGKKAVVALREPSLGPVFGIKGGAAGGGYAQAIPMEDINLHFTGDMHAITAANNLLAAALDNHLHQGNPLRIDPRRILLKRCLDMNDRALRGITIGLGGAANGIPREDSFQITVASEVMAILCLARDEADLKARLARILVAFTYEEKSVYAADLSVCGAMALLLKDAFLPNLVQTLEHTPVLIHGGPFANIAHGCNSVRATQTALALGEIAVTEAGFGADLGAEKFLDIKCPAAGLSPDCAVLVATVRAIKYHGGAEKATLTQENLPALRQGLCNLKTHIENLQKFGLPVVVALNRFPSDSDAELDLLRDACAAYGAPAALTEVFTKGGAGGEALGSLVLEALAAKKADYHPLCASDLPVTEKLERIAREIYRADGVTLTPAAQKSLARLDALGYGRLPVCVAKTQYSLSDNPQKRGAPCGFTVTVRDIRVSAGAGFVVCYTGDILTMPGLPKTPAANAMDIDETGKITGLF